MEPIIRLEKIKKVFRRSLTPHGPTIAFRLDKLVVAEGEHVALVGPSGCGKTSLLKLIAGLDQAEEGDLEVAGIDLKKLSPGELDRFRGRSIGFVFQDFNLIAALSARENVLVGLRFGRTVPRGQWRARSREMLDLVGLGHRHNSRPETLSQGEQQRVAIARALVNHPPIILADEPTANLDPATGAQVFDLLVNICRDAHHTLLVVTHDPAVYGRLPRRVDCTHLIHESDGAQ